MSYGRAPWANEAREEAWLEWAGEQAKDAIINSLPWWPIEDLERALTVVDSPACPTWDDPAIDVIEMLSAVIGCLTFLEPEDAIKVCAKMKLPGDWEYSDNWDPRSL